MDHCGSDVPSTPQPMGMLGLLPAELRLRIYEHLIVAGPGSLTTYGAGSGVDTAIIRTCRSISSEAVHVLYSTKHRIKYDSARFRRTVKGSTSALPAYAPLYRLRRVELSIIFATSNRGECETEIHYYPNLQNFTENYGLALHRSDVLEELTILLYNVTTRKIGAKRLRAPKLMEQMRNVLLPLACVRASTKVWVAGFDTLDFADLYEELRTEWAGKRPPYEYLLSQALE